MKRITLFFFVFTALLVQAQELRLHSFVCSNNDLSASIYSMVDGNDEPCALIKVQSSNSGLKFSSPNIVGNVTFKDSEYWVYMSSGSKRLKISAEGCLPLQVEFSEYGIRSLEPKTTYTMVVTFERKQSTEMWKPLVKRKSISIGSFLPTIAASSTGVLTSVVDYGVSDVEDLRDLERPYYEPQLGFLFSYERQIPLYSTLYLELGGELSYTAFTNNFTNKDLVYTVNGTSYSLVYGNIEKYQLYYASVPISLGYSYPISKNCGIGINIGAIFGFGLLGVCEYDGYSNCTWFGGKSATSSVSGIYNLFSGNYELTQSYSSGSDETYDFLGQTEEAPYSREIISGLVKLNFNVSRVVFSLQYRLCLSNIGNQAYWSNEQGDRVSGLFFFGQPISSMEGIKSYEQKHNALCLSISYKF